MRENDQASRFFNGGREPVRAEANQTPSGQKDARRRTAASFSPRPMSDSWMARFSSATVPS